MARSTSSWILIGGLAAAATLQPTGCVTDNGDAPADALLAALLAAVGPEVVSPALDRFAVEIDALGVAAAGWQSAVDGSGADSEAAESARDDAQAQWLAAMAAWQELEVMQIGPAGSSLTALGGQDLRDEIYSWPTVNPCRLDQETVEARWGEPTWFEDNLVNSYGLDGLEWLLFAGPENDCYAQVDVNADGSWDALGPEGVTANRAAFSVALADEIGRQTQALQDAWSPDGGDFSGALAAADGAPYDSEQLALNALFDALFYLETVTKDRKLAQPMGLQSCAESICPDDVEGQLSGSSLLAVEANLIGFRELFTGGAGDGMDDLLADLGHGDLSDQILADTDAALAAVAALEGPLDAAITDRPEDVQALYDAVKAVTDALKGDLATVLALEIPSEAAGDND